MKCRGSTSASEDGWTRRRVIRSSMLGIDIENQARVILLVQRRANHTLGDRRAAALDVQAHTLGVALGPTCALGLMKGDGLMPQHILPGRDGGRDGSRPREVGGDHLVRAPRPRRLGPVDEPDRVDLEELELRLVDVCAVVVGARREVVQHGPVVRLGPVVGPEDRHVGAGLHRCGDGGRCGADVADHVRAGDVLDEAEGLVLGNRPADHLGWWVLVLLVGAIPLDASR